MNDLLIKNGLVYIDDEFKKINIAIKGEVISYLGNEDVPALKVIDCEGIKIIPGLIDSHVHFELSCGTITSRDDFRSGTISGAYGGVTTVIDFLDPSSTVEELIATYNNRKKLAKKSVTDYCFHACIKEPKCDLEEYVKKVKELGMNTIKLFTTYSETNRRTRDKDIIKLLELSKKYHVLITAHIENDELINHDDKLLCTDIDKARPSICEISEALKLALYAKETGGYLYMVHCSSGKTLKYLVEQYGDILNKNLFIESCPQYFAFDNSEFSKPNGYLFTFAPPLRSPEEKDLLKQYYRYISTIGTDHCSFTNDDKLSHPLLKGHPLGIGGIESSFSVMHSLFGDNIINKMSKNIAELMGINQKGCIKVGNYADLVFYIEKDTIIQKPHSNVDYSIYEGLHSDIEIIDTIIRGRYIIKNKKYIEHVGRLLNEESAD